MLLYTIVCNPLQQPNDGKILTDCMSSRACLESFFARVHIKPVIPRALNVATPVQKLKQLNLLFCQWPHKHLQETWWCQKLEKNNRAVPQNGQTWSSLCLTYSQIRQLRKQAMPELWEELGSAKIYNRYCTQCPSSDINLLLAFPLAVSTNSIRKPLATQTRLVRMLHAIRPITLASLEGET